MFSGLRDRNISSLFEFSPLAEFFTAKPDTNREHKRDPRVQRGLRTKTTEPAGHIGGLTRAHIEGIQ